jgi:MoxR-like ATPase
MSDTASWQENNVRYLTAALAWLRLRMEQKAPWVQSSIVLTATPAQEAARRGFMRRAAEAPASAPQALLPPPSPISDEQVAQAAADMAAAEAIDPPPALIILSRQFQLTRFERDALLLCAAIELDTRIASLCARIQDDAARPYPTFALALALFEDAAWEALSPERPLRYWRLIEINQPAAQPLTTSPLRADERIVNFLKGLNYLDDRLTALLAPLDVRDGAIELPPSQQAAVGTIVQRMKQAAGLQHLPVVQLLGMDAPSKQLIAWHSANALGLHLYRLAAELLPAQAAELESVARLWQRETILLPIALYLDAHEVERSSTSEGPASSINRFLARTDGVLFLDTRETWPGSGRDIIARDIATPTPAEQQAAWAAAIGPLAGDSPARLAGQFNLGLAAIRQIAQAALADAPDDDAHLFDQLWNACLLGTRPQLDALAQRLEPKATWDDLVLPAAETALLKQIAAQIGQRAIVYDEWGFRRKMNRGLGISVLLAGESGTGKTMAAEVIANDLRLNLYRIDLSAVVSKYIGETEKNLRKLFDAAEQGGAILFFDEADALFGKRSEVKDAHDRYANIEVNYLLQRMEAYNGLAILATNMKNALDSAFLRRLRFIVPFAFPGIEERKAMWRKVFPQADAQQNLAGTPTTRLDYDWLARLDVTGGSIQNIALNAAFLAAQAGTPVTMPLVLEAARIELRKLERPIKESDFRWEKAAEVVTA